MSIELCADLNERGIAVKGTWRLSRASGIRAPRQTSERCSEAVQRRRHRCLLPLDSSGGGDVTVRCASDNIVEAEEVASAASLMRRGSGPVDGGVARSESCQEPKYVERREVSRVRC